MVSCQLPLLMAEIAFENGRISNFKGLVTFTLDRVILHTFMHHKSTSTYKPNFIEIEKTFCGRTDERTYVRTYGRTDIRDRLYYVDSVEESNLKKQSIHEQQC